MRRIPLLAILCLVAACGSATPDSNPSPTAAPTAVPTPTPSPTPTPVPTPLPSLPPLDVSAFEPGWTLAATDTNVGPVHETDDPLDDRAALRGRGRLRRRGRTGRHASRGRWRPEEGPSRRRRGRLGHVPCTNVTPTITEFDSTELPAWIGVSISPSAAGPQHIQYRIAVGTAG